MFFFVAQIQYGIIGILREHVSSMVFLLQSNSIYSFERNFNIQYRDVCIYIYIEIPTRLIKWMFSRFSHRKLIDSDRWIMVRMNENYSGKTKDYHQNDVKQLSTTWNWIEICFYTEAIQSHLIITKNQQDWYGVCVFINVNLEYIDWFIVISITCFESQSMWFIM